MFKVQKASLATKTGTVHWCSSVQGQIGKSSPDKDVESATKK